MQRNDELIDKVVDYIREHPEEWDQSTWISACGTEACFAGHAMLLSGYTIKRICDEWGSDPDGHECVASGHMQRTAFIRPSGEAVKFGNEDLEANGLLGFTAAEGNSIYFSSMAGPEELDFKIARIRDGKLD